MLLVHVILIIAAIVRPKTTSTSTDIGKSSHLAFFFIFMHCINYSKMFIYMHVCGMW